MKTRSVSDAILGHLDEAVLGYPVAYDNVDNAALSRPYLDVTFAARERSSRTLRGRETVTEMGRLSITIAHDLGKGIGPAEDIADQIAELFYEGMRLTPANSGLGPYGDVVVTITGPAQIRGGFAIGQEWRVPVIVPYAATTA